MTILLGLFKLHHYQSSGWCHPELAKDDTNIKRAVLCDLREFLCALCGKKLLTAKDAKESAKNAKFYVFRFDHKTARCSGTLR
jgi:hypothetical protein